MRSVGVRSMALLAGLWYCFAATQTLRADYRVKAWRQLATGTARLSYLKTQNIIAYDKPNSSGLFDVWTMGLDGSNNSCLTCPAAAVNVLGALNKGNPAWHPSGKFIAFEVQMGPSSGTAENQADFPGSGWSNNLWIMDAAGQHFWQITNLPLSGGVIYPRFSWGGNKLTWGQRIGPSPLLWGTWQLMVGDFVVSSSGVPSVQNIQTLTPAYHGPNQYYYEPHGFSADDQTVFIMSNFGPGGIPFFSGPGPMDIFGFNLATNQWTALTSTPGQWNEFPAVIPNGASVVYMSTVGTDTTKDHFKGDLWMMNTDGSNKYRLTYFNDPNSPDYQPNGIITADPEWNADGSELVLYGNLGSVQYLPGKMWVLDIEPAAATFNGASFQRGAAPGVVVSMFAPPNLATQTAAAGGQPLPTNLANTTVTVTDAKGTSRPAGLYFVSPGQINAVIPAGTAPGPAVLQATSADGTQVRATVLMAPVAPGLFTMNQNGKGVAAGYVQVVSGGSQSTVPLYSCPSSGGTCTTNPINVSDSSSQNYLILFGTGFRGRSSLQGVGVTVGNQALPAIFAGPQGQYDALDQVNVQLPSTLAGAGVVNVVLTVDGITANTVQIQIQ